VRIAMIGGGYVGLVSGACFAEFGSDVAVVESDPARPPPPCRKRPKASDDSRRTCSFQRYVLLWKLTKTKTHTASLLAKPTLLNINLGSDRFSMFNKERDIPERCGCDP
jgi:2-polyprenyl-6-methoxyphenol hydroxylase-like FAD-dependent oxidoreductase